MIFGEVHLPFDSFTIVKRGFQRGLEARVALIHLVNQAWHLTQEISGPDDPEAIALRDAKNELQQSLLDRYPHHVARVRDDSDSERGPLASLQVDLPSGKIIDAGHTGAWKA